MHDTQELVTQLDAVFHPKSVAIVGVPRGMKMGKLFLISLLELGFAGDIYPVHPEADEIDGIKAYPNVSAIPGPVDLAIILVPHQGAMPVVRECAAKSVKAAVLFTAGYKETKTEDGKRLEKELTSIARSSGMRLMGPNCMGIYCPKSGLSFFPGLSKEPGTVAFITHSGSLGNILGRMAPAQGIRFSKAISLGNECDMDSAELLVYLSEDPETEVIGAYLEGIKDGRAFLDALGEAARRKPVVLWKVGLTPEGSKAAASHTGALSGSREIWESVVRQTGAVSVVGLEALADTLMGFSLLPPKLGDRIAILSGPGGLAVSAAEACGAFGLRLANLADETRSVLAEFIPPTGTSLGNPIDVGLSASLEMDIYVQAARNLAADPGVDAVAVVGAGFSPETNRIYVDSMIQARQDFDKPFLIINIPGFDPELAKEICQAGVPFFASAERAMSVYARVREYQITQHHRSNADIA